MLRLRSAAFRPGHAVGGAQQLRERYGEAGREVKIIVSFVGKRIAGCAMR